MTEARVELQIDPRFREALSRDGLDLLLREVAEAALRHEDAQDRDRVTVIITGDAELRRLNRDFMGYDEPTDVLSFNTAVAPGDGPDGTWPDAGEEEADALGDIAISFERAVAQAGEAGHGLAHELSVLTAHGVLHLLGYDHAEPGEQRVMFGKTDEILASVAGPAGSAPGA